MTLTRPTEPTVHAGSRQPLITGGVQAVTVFVLAAVLAGCSPAPPAAGPPAPTPQNSVGPCAVMDGPVPFAVSAPEQAPLSRLESTPAPLGSGVGSEGEWVTADEVITDFPIPPRAVIPSETIVLVSITVRPKAHGPRAQRSLSMVAFRPAGGSWLIDRNCPLTDTDITAAMRAAGHPPLPEQVADGQEVKGWVAFSVNRYSSALALRIRIFDATGISTSDVPVLLRTPST
ncbi:hypothetical protein [Pseudonocardia spinosispora]|uniref:hypothetical protein n=1 Tax=Pseudonocardia spinosispora TaxID=103441 RepID=UPI0004117FCF|nr:hypothetical protein [Pseudonocardia spinosispora]